MDPGSSQDKNMRKLFTGTGTEDYAREVFVRPVDSDTNNCLIQG